jgi:thioredoxin-dependent peroxiredoxin
MRLCSLRLVLLAGLVVVGAMNPAQAREDKKDQVKVEEGQWAPKLDLPATQINKVLPDSKDAKTINLSDFRGKKNIVLFFYPKAMTKGCTIESCAFSAKAADFAKLDTVVIGISTDKLDDQLKFTEKEKLEVPLLADPDKTMTRAFGALNPERGMANRYTYVIDKKGVIRKIYKQVKPAEHPAEVLEYVKENLSENK